MKPTATKSSNPFENVNRRTVLGALGVGATGILVGCNDDISPLKVSLTSDLSDITTAGGKITLTATVDSASGMADTVEFYEGNDLSTPIKTLTSPPFAFDIVFSDPKSNGMHFYSTRLVSSVTGKDAWSKPISVMVNIGSTIIPTVTLTSSSTTLPGAGKITLSAAVSGGAVIGVEFFDGTTSVGQGTLNGSAYTLDVQVTATPASHSFTAIGTVNSTTKTAASNAVAVTINISIPTVTLTSSSSTLTGPGPITLSAAIAGGTVSGVEFFDGGTSIGMGTLNGSAYTLVVQIAATPTSHSFTAVGTVNNTTKTASSNAVPVTINIPIPTVTLSSSSTALTAPGKITLSAAIAGGTVTGVEFFDGATSIGMGTLNGSAYTLVVQIAATPASHSFTAVGTVNSTIKTAPSNAVSVGIALPTITLTASSTNVTAAGNVVLTATVAGGTVTQIEFFEGATSLGVVTAAPYSKTITFTPSSPAQSHTYIAKGTVVAGTTVDSAPVAVNVNIGNLAPTITLSSSSISVTANGSITLTAIATAKTGTISKVEFYEGATLIRTVTTAPYTLPVTFATTANGTHNYTAKATDSSNNSATSAPVVAVTVNIPTAAPTVTLGSSSNNVTANGSINLTATVTSDPAVTITKVDFYDGATLLGTVNAAPYSFTPAAFTSANNGTHNYTAKATDSSLKTGTSTIAAVVVNIAVISPTVSLGSSSTSVTAASSVTLTAAVTPGSGTISKVEFFEGATLLSTKTAAPYTYAPAYTSTNNGTHTYTAVVTDSNAKTGTSAAVAVAVNIAATVTPPTVTLTSSSTSVTAAGSITLKATVTVGSGTISKVEFFDGTTLLGTGTLTAGTYNYTPTAFTSANNGTHSYTAKVTASDATTTSATVSVVVNISTATGTRIALYTQMAAAGSYVNFNHPTSGIKCILYRAATAQNGGVANAGAFYVAYSRKCTHAGTVITNNPNTANPHVLICQDHGAQYNMDSNCAPIPNSQQNAPSPLPTIVITAGSDGIYI
jgi:Rieske Fe-S protein